MYPKSVCVFPPAKEQRTIGSSLRAVFRSHIAFQSSVVFFFCLLPLPALPCPAHLPFICFQDCCRMSSCAWFLVILISRLSFMSTILLALFLCWNTNELWCWYDKVWAAWPASHGSELCVRKSYLVVCRSCCACWCLVITFATLTLSIVNVSFSLPEWQAVKMTFFAPCSIL